MKIWALFAFITVISNFAWAQDPSDDPALIERVRILEEKLAELQADQNLDFIRFGGQMTSSYDDISVKEAYPATLDNTGLQYLRLRYSFDMFMDLDPRLKIYTRMTASKFFNRAEAQGLLTRPNDLDAAHKYNGPSVVLEKAYLDYSVSPSLVLSIGKLPTAEGLPTHLWDNQPRQGTYPYMNFNIPLDGLAATYKFNEELPEGHVLAVRGLYTPITTVNLGNGENSYLNPPKEDVNGTTPTGRDVPPMSNAFTLQFDYSAEHVPLGKYNGIIFQNTKLRDLPLPSGVGTSDLSYSGEINTLYIEFLDFLRSRFDFTAMYSYTIIDAYGFFAPGYGAGGTMRESHLYGQSLLVSGRYHFKKWIMGAEYIQNSRQAFSFSTADEDLVKFYRNPGWGYHIYFTKRLNDFLTLRIGYRGKTQTNYYVAPGPIQSTDRDIRNYYIRLRTDF
ncbi:DUF3373 family protein [Bdellovibrio bacteriovorus]